MLSPYLRLQVSAEMNVTVNQTPFAETIPRFIHQTYYTAQLPDDLSENVNHLKTLNPRWQYIFWDDTSIACFIREHYGNKLLRIFNRINPEYGAARADLFRYLVLYRLGGVYLDIKSAADIPLDEVISPDDSYIISQWRNGVGEPYEGWGLHSDLEGIPRGEYQQWYLVAAAGHPLLRAVIERVILNLQSYRYDKVGAGRLGVLRLTGPIAYTKAIHPLLSTQPHRIVKDQTELGIRYSIFERDGRQYHRQIFKNHYAAIKTPIVRRPLPYGPINYMLYKAKYFKLNYSRFRR